MPIHLDFIAFDGATGMFGAVFNCDVMVDLVFDLRAMFLKIADEVKRLFLSASNDTPVAKIGSQSGSKSVKN